MRRMLFAITMLSALSFTACKSGGGGATPTGALKAMAEDTKKGDIKAITKHFCKADQKAMDEMMKMVEGIAKLAGKDVNELMKEQMLKDDKFNLKDVQFKNEKITGDKATVDIMKKDEQTETVELVKEGGSWKMCPGLAGKMKDAMGGKDLNEGLKEAQDAMKNMKPEDLEALKKMGEEMQKNMKPEDVEKLKKMGEAMQKQ